MLLPLLVVLLLIIIQGSYGDVIKERDYILEQSRQTVNTPDWSNAYPIEKCAYVIVHYERAIRSYEETERLLGVRVLLQTLILTETKYDIIVLLNEEASESTVEMIQTETKGTTVRIRRVPSLTGIDPECQHKLMPMYAWNMIEYDRILNIGVGTLVILNMDELFLCGHYCSLFSSWVYFSDLLTVLKPDNNVYNKLLAEYNNNILPNHQSSNSHYTIEQCDYESQVFFLNFFGTPEGLSLKDKEMQKHLGLTRSAVFFEENGQSEEKSLRIPYRYNVNAMHYYENFNLDLFRTERYKELPIPGHSLGFWGEKPYRWERCLYFDLHWEYQAWRETLLDEDFSGFIISRIIGLCLIFGLIEKGLPFVFDKYVTKSKYRNELVIYTRKILETSYGFDILGLTIGGILTWYSGIFLMYYSGIFPGLIPPKYAWPLYICYVTIVIYGWLKFISLFYIDDINNNDNNSMPIVSLKWMIGPFFVQWFTFYSMLSSLHFQFGEKMFVLFFLTGFAILSLVLLFRKYFQKLRESLCSERKFHQHE